MEEHRDLQKLVRKSSGKSKLQSKEITTKRKIEQVMGNVVRLESQKRSGYEQYVLGKLSKEKFLELKQGLENEITTLKQTKAEKEKEASGRELHKTPVSLERQGLLRLLPEADEISCTQEAWPFF